MPQLDFSWWMTNLLIKWTLWATIFLLLTFWVKTKPLQKNNKEKNK